jgi:WD40 repeat protein
VQIAEKAGQAMLDMQESVRTITEPEFHYDVEYINTTMGWGDAAAAGGGAGMARQLHLVPAHSIADAHTDTIFALALDPAHSQFVSGGKDTYLQVWSQAGQPLQKLDLGDVYTSSMDFHPRLNMLLCTCINPGNQKLRLAAFMSGQQQGFGPKGTNSREDMVAVASVRALPETNGFLTGETVVVDNQPKPVVRFWDLACELRFAPGLCGWSFQACHANCCCCREQAYLPAC